MGVDPRAWLEALRTSARERDEAGLRRALAPRSPLDAVIDMAGNDYLGLARHPAVIEAGAGALRAYGLGATGSRLVRGSTDVHARLEAALASWLGAESALVYSSGYLANLGVLRLLVPAGGRIVSDAHNHASLVDGCRATRARITVTRHLDLDAIDAALSAPDPRDFTEVAPSSGPRPRDFTEVAALSAPQARDYTEVAASSGPRPRDFTEVAASGGPRPRDYTEVAALSAPQARDFTEVAASGGRASSPAVVVTESVFSVNGDLAPLREMHAITRRHGALLLVDDAHAVGLLGPAGAGGVAAAGLAGEPDVIVTATLSKSFGGAGGAVAGPAELIAALVDTGRTFIYDTGMPPALAAGGLAALDLIRAADDLRAEVHVRGELITAKLRAAGLAVWEPAAGVLSVAAPGPAEAVAWAAACLDAGVAVGCFRPPSTPDGSSRLRLTINAGVSRADFEHAIDVILETAP
jgi:7-keto-8-aminopelargonate synthetase-like enzyme